MLTRSLTVHFSRHDKGYRRMALKQHVGLSLSPRFKRLRNERR